MSRRPSRLLTVALAGLLNLGGAPTTINPQPPAQKEGTTSAESTQPEKSGKPVVKGLNLDSVKNEIEKTLAEEAHCKDMKTTLINSKDGGHEGVEVRGETEKGFSRCIQADFMGAKIGRTARQYGPKEEKNGLAIVPFTTYKPNSLTVNYTYKQEGEVDFSGIR